MPRDHSRTYLLLFGGIFLLMSGLYLLRFFAQPSDIWWKQKGLSVPLADAADRVEVYVRAMPLLEQVRAGRIQLVTDVGLTPVVASDVRMRFNNWDRVRAQSLPGVLVAAVCAGASGVFLLSGVLGWSPNRRIHSAD